MKIVQPAAIWIARALVAAVFLYAGFVKLGESEQFAITMAKFYVLPEGSPAWIALGLPALEVVAGALLLIPRTARVGATVVAILLAGFIATLAWALSQGLVLECGCFGDDPASVPTKGKMIFAIWRDAALLALTLGLAWRRLPGPWPR